jgi:hypothetical protein
MKNIIILTTGRSGSSVLAGLLAGDDRYWVDKAAIPKRKGYPFGDFENPELIRLNKQLYTHLDYPNPALHCLKGGTVSVDDLKRLWHRADAAPFRQFVDTCERNRPWLWKDPRLAYTMFYWSNRIDLAQTQFVHIARGRHEIFLSLSKSGIKYTKSEVYRFVEMKEGIIEAFFNEHRILPLRIDYQDLWNRSALNSKIEPILGFTISRQAYDTIVVPKNRPKESSVAFLMRYTVGVAKLKAKRLLMKEIGA